MKTLEVVCGISIDDKGVFLAKLNINKSNAGCWEFPGGKVNKGETHQVALGREILEELNVIVNVKNYFKSSEIIVGNVKIILHSYLVDFLSEPDSSIDHEMLGRFTADTILHLKLSKADIPIVEKLINNKLI